MRIEGGKEEGEGNEAVKVTQGVHGRVQEGYGVEGAKEWNE